MISSNLHPAGPQMAEPAVCPGSPPAVAARPAKRLYDAFFAGSALLLLSPLFLLIAACVKAADGGPVFYRQARVGQNGRLFRIWKFRTMVPRADEAGPSVTRDGDARVTWIGRLLRKAKLDELPQLWNVLKGDMSLVGPRPEVPRYVARYTARQRGILRYKPGITDPASICFRHEENLLASAESIEEFYVQHCLPRKLQINLEYARNANLASDTWIILQTVCPYWLGLLSLHGLILVASFLLSCQLTYDFAAPSLGPEEFFGGMFAVVALQLGCLMWRRQCHGLLSFFSLPELRQVGIALACAASLLLGLWGLAGRPWPPRNLILVDLLVSVCLLGGARLLLRFWRECSSAAEDSVPVAPPVRVGIIGANSAGAHLARELMAGKRLGRTVVAFFDDDAWKWQKRIHEIPVVGMPECLLNGWSEKLDEVIIAAPDAPPERLRQINQLLQRAGLRTYTASAPLSLCSIHNCSLLGDRQL